MGSNVIALHTPCDSICSPPVPKCACQRFPNNPGYSPFPLSSWPTSTSTRALYFSSPLLPCRLVTLTNLPSLPHPKHLTITLSTGCTMCKQDMYVIGLGVCGVLLTCGHGFSAVKCMLNTRKYALHTLNAYVLCAKVQVRIQHKNVLCTWPCSYTCIGVSVWCIF